MRRAAFLLLLPLLAACDSNSGTSQTTRDFLAYNACKDAVAQQLKAPGSAAFQSELDVDYKTSGGNNITITGWVDAQNSYGAKLRTTWTCTADVDQQGNVSNAEATVS